MPRRSALGTTHLVVALTLLAGVLRFATLDAKGFWEDEAATVFLVRSGFGHMLSQLATGGTENTPPLYFSVAWLWAKAFGTGEVGLRSLSALLGTATVPLVYVAGRELVSKRAALVAALLVTVNPLILWYSQAARSYALLMLLT